VILQLSFGFGDYKKAPFSGGFLKDAIHEVITFFRLCRRCIYRLKASTNLKLLPTHRPLASRWARLPINNRQD
jgi:hypothetical protein